MLAYLKIKNLALIANAEVEFAPGFNVITGETGSGKSIFLNTLALLTGERADKNLIRTGSDRCELSAAIRLNRRDDAPVRAKLEELGIELEGEEAEVTLRRVITRTQTRSFINDTPVANATLKELGSVLMDIHSADEAHSLWSRSRQLELLDRYGVSGASRNAYAAVWENRCRILAEREEFLRSIPPASEIARLEAEAAEIAAVAPEAGEDDRLAARHKAAANQQEILRVLGAAEQALSGENGLLDQLANVYRELEHLTAYDSSDAAEKLAAACAAPRDELTDLGRELERYAETIDLDPEAFAALENRLGALYTLKRRYGPTLEAVIRRWQEADAAIAAFHTGDRRRAELDAAVAAAETAVREQAQALTAARQQAAEKFSDAVRSKLSKLGFPYSVFEVGFTPKTPDANGADLIEMQISVNPGHPAAPLRQVASSGELARVMLAIKAVLAELDAIPVLIFDEIDVNIGGETAFAVADEMAALAKHRQLLCISHLAQVAARGTTHFAVQKSVSAGTAVSEIRRLSPDERVDELSRMLGGSGDARIYAEALLKPAGRRKSK